MYTPRNLQRWTWPDSYIGASWPNWFRAGFGQSRDSDARERSNFAAALKALGGETETVTVVRESHWAVGWVEWIALHETDDDALRAADGLRDRMAAYPVLDEDAWVELEEQEAADFWNRLTAREKVRHAMEQRDRCHWLSRIPVWPYGRLDYDGLCARDDEIARYVCDQLRSV